MVNQFNGNPTLSKDRMTSIKYGRIYNKHEKKVLRVGANDSSMKSGCDCDVAFVTQATIEMMRKKWPNIDH